MIVERFALRRWYDQFKGDHVATPPKIFEVCYASAPWPRPVLLREALACIIARRRIWLVP